MLATSITNGEWASVSQLSAMERRAAAYQSRVARSHVPSAGDRRGNSLLDGSSVAIAAAAKDASKAQFLRAVALANECRTATVRCPGGSCSNPLYLGDASASEEEVSDGEPSLFDKMMPSLFGEVPTTVCGWIVATAPRKNAAIALARQESRLRKRIAAMATFAVRSLLRDHNAQRDVLAAAERRFCAHLLQCTLAEEAHRAQVHDRWATGWDALVTSERSRTEQRRRLAIRRRGRRGSRSVMQASAVEQGRLTRLARLDALLTGRGPSQGDVLAQHLPSSRTPSLIEGRRREARWGAEATKAAASLKRELLTRMPPLAAPAPKSTMYTSL